MSNKGSWKLSNIDKENIVNDYINNQTIPEISKKYNISTSSISAILKRRNIKTRDYKLTEFETNLAIKEYLDGFSSSQIANKYSVSATTIKNILKRHNISRRNASQCHQAYKINENYFNNINTEDKAYFLGLLYADGCNYPENHHVSLSLMEEDKEILEKFQQCLETDKPLRFVISKNKNKKNSYSLDITNIAISESLEKLGVVKAKTFKIIFPEWLDKNLYRHFIRGYFDGDGCIHLHKTKNNTWDGSFQIVGTNNFCEKLSDIFRNEIGITCRVKKVIYSNGISRVMFAGNNQLLKIMNYLYDDSCYYLKRKFDKFMIIKNQYLERINKPKKHCLLCERKVEAFGYCKRHYYHLFNGKEKEREYKLRKKLKEAN
jgi:Mor family transcriptional regulator